ncbi:MAG: stage V sporulation protein SpoVM [Thermoanaerobacterales bacterium]|nr:stage V sporulation protein SpoVM [Thermoanaerobacterales bacterium]
MGLHCFQLTHKEESEMRIYVLKLPKGLSNIVKKILGLFHHDQQ